MVTSIQPTYIKSYQVKVEKTENTERLRSPWEERLKPF